MYLNQLMYFLKVSQMNMVASTWELYMSPKLIYLDWT